jgi:hypothetical protein
MVFAAIILAGKAKSKSQRSVEHNFDKSANIKAGLHYIEDSEITVEILHRKIVSFEEFVRN